LGDTTLAKDGRNSGVLEFAMKSRSVEPEDPTVVFNVACLHALIDKREEALDYLERSVMNGFGHMASMVSDPDLDSIRRTPWFQAIVRAMSSDCGPIRASSRASCAEAPSLVGLPRLVV